MIVSSRKIHQKFANFLVAPSRPRNCGDQLPAPLFFISDFFRKVQKVRQFILGLKGEILILAKMELPFRFLEPPRPDGPKNRISRGSKTRLLKFPHYLFDFSLGLSPRTFLPIKKPLFFFTDFFGQNIFCPESYFFGIFPLEVDIFFVNFPLAAVKKKVVFFIGKNVLGLSPSEKSNK